MKPSIDVDKSQMLGAATQPTKKRETMRKFNLKASGAIAAILIGGTIAATIDYSWAVSMYGWGMARGIAAGLLGRDAFQGGTGTVLFGTALHFFIMYGMASVYFAASRQWIFMKQNWIVCGLLFGIVQFLVMNFVVLPLSALHVVKDIVRFNMLRDIIVNMFIIGLPIAYSVKRFSK